MQERWESGHNQSIIHIVGHGAPPILLRPKLWDVHPPRTNPLYRNPSGSYNMYVHCSLDEFPRCADWKHLVAGFRAPECPIKVSLPCAGVYGSKACFSNVGAACQPVNIYDIEEGYADFLKHVTDGAELNLGKQRGDILNIDFAKLQDSHILLSRPPPCFRQGSLENNTDNEKVFHRVLQMIIYLA